MEHSIDFNGPIEKQALIYIKYNFGMFSFLKLKTWITD